MKQNKKSSPYGVFEITNVPKFLDSLLPKGPSPAFVNSHLEELVSWQKEHPLQIKRGGEE